MLSTLRQYCCLDFGISFQTFAWYERRSTISFLHQCGSHFACERTGNNNNVILLSLRLALTRLRATGPRTSSNPICKRCLYIVWWRFCSHALVTRYKNQTYGILSVRLHSILAAEPFGVICAETRQPNIQNKERYFLKTTGEN